VIYIIVLAGLALIFSIVRIIFLNTEIRTLDAAGTQTHVKFAAWVAEHPLDTATPEDFAASKAMLPQDIQEAETEYLWLWNERDSKKESRTLWIGGAITALIVCGIGFFVHF